MEAECIPAPFSNLANSCSFEEETRMGMYQYHGRRQAEDFAKEILPVLRLSGKEYCKFRLHWTLDGHAHDGCAFQCYNFDAFNLEYVPF